MGDRRSLALSLRIVGSLVMLGILFKRVHVTSVLPRWDHTTPWWLLAAATATATGIVLSAVRWREVLQALGIRARVRTLLHHYLAGLFVGNFLPSTIGGDVVRVRRLSAEQGASTDVFASVVLERLTGWLVLPLITLGALASNAGLRREGTATVVAVVVSVGTLVLLSAVLCVVAHPRLGGRLTGRSSWQRFAAAVHLATNRIRRYPAAIVRVIVAGFAYQLIVVVAALLAARAIGIDQVGLTAALAFVPAVAIVQVLPISLGGLGVREGAFVLFLHPLGVPTGRAVALGLLVYGLNLAVSLAGAPSFAVGGTRRRGEMLV